MTNQGDTVHQLAAAQADPDRIDVEQLLRPPRVRALQAAVLCAVAGALSVVLCDIVVHALWLGERHNTHVYIVHAIAIVAVSALVVYPIVRHVLQRGYHATMAVCEGEVRYRQSFHHADIGIAHVDTDGNWLEVNDRLCELTGYSREELLNRSLLDITHPDDYAESQEYVQRLRSGQITRYGLEKRYIRGNGTTVWCHVSVARVRDVWLGKAFSIAMVQDVTARKHAEEALLYRANMERIISEVAAAFVNVPGAELDAAISSALGAVGSFAGVDRSYVFLFNEDGQTVSNTHEWCASGIVPEKDNLQNIPVSSIPWWMERLRRFEEIYLPTLEDLPPHAATERRILEAQEIQSLIVVPMVRGQELVGFLGFDAVRDTKHWSAEDVTLLKTLADIVVGALARQQAERALRESEEKYRLVVELTPVMVCSWLPDTTLTFVNSAYARFFGSDASKLQGRRFLELVPDDARQVILESIENMRSTRQGMVYEHAIVTPDGERRWQRWNDTPLFDEHGEVVRFHSIGEDITDRKLAEDEVRRLNRELEDRVNERTAQLVAANKELQAFSYTVSHDLRAPVRTLHGIATILEEDFAAQLPKPAEQHLQAIKRLAEHMSELVDDLLALSRASRKELAKTEVHMDELVRTALGELESEYSDRSVKFDIEALPPAHGDPGLLKQVWVNLLGNALKFSRGHKPAHIGVGALERNGATVYWVRDNGIGFHPEDHDRMFGVFTRLHAGEDYEGTGVGLAIVHNIVERHGGKVWAEGAPGEGAVFYFTL